MFSGGTKMYNDEENLYHYTYRKDGSEAGAPMSGPGRAQPPIQEMKPVKKQGKLWPKLVALGLCCALVGGSIGGGLAWYLGNRPGKTSFQVSDGQSLSLGARTLT